RDAVHLHGAVLRRARRGLPARREAARRAMGRAAVLLRRPGGGVRRAGCGATTLVIKATRLRGAPAEKLLVYQLAVSIPMLALGVLLMGERMTSMPSGFALGWLAYQTFWVVSLTY